MGAGVKVLGDLTTSGAGGELERGTRWHEATGDLRAGE